MRHTWKLTGVALCLLGGCATSSAARLCYVPAEDRARSFPTPETWFSLLLHGYDAKEGRAPRPAVDCAGAPVLWEEPATDECREPGPQPEPLPPKERLTETDVVLSTLRAGVRLVWVITRRYDNGEGLGPVALVETTEKGFEVRALGSLRALVSDAKLRMERVGGVEVLVAEGEACTQEAPPVCRRAARLMPLRRGRFFPEAVSSAERACYSSAWFPLSREQVFELSNGLRRRFELTSTLTFGGEALVVQEQVTVSDSDPKQPSVQERLFRRATHERKLQWKKDVLVGSEPSLWIRMVEQQAQAGARPLPEKPLVPPPAPAEPPTQAATPTSATTSSAQEAFPITPPPRPPTAPSTAPATAGDPK